MNEDAPFERIGGEEGVRALVDRFYDLMDTLPEAAGIRAMHPRDLRMSREKLYLFLVGWLGGPPLYVERFGHPRLRARHLPFPIGDSEVHRLVQEAVAMFLAEQRTATRERLKGLKEETRQAIVEALRSAT